MRLEQIGAYFKHVPEAPWLRRAEKCARLRMTIPYDRSVAIEGLIPGTSNRSELLLETVTLSALTIAQRR